MDNEKKGTWITKPKAKRKYEGNRKERQKIYNNKIWRGMTKNNIANHPICAVCEIEGRIRLAAHTHHLISFMKGQTEEERQQLAFNPDNIISVCAECHDKIHNGIYRGAESLEQIRQYYEAHKKEK